jgi:hypothetical protein
VVSIENGKPLPIGDVDGKGAIYGVAESPPFKKPTANIRIPPATAPDSAWVTAISAAVDEFGLPLPATIVMAASWR